MQFYRPGAVAAPGLHCTRIIAFRFCVAAADRYNSCYAGIAQDGFPAGIVPGNESKIRKRSRYRFFFFLSLFIFRLYFLFRLIGFLTHVHAGNGFRDRLGLIGIYADADGHIDTMCLGVGHVRPFFTNDRLG